MKTNEDQAEAAAPAGPGAGDDAGAGGLLASADSAAQRMEKAAAELRKENDRREQIIARDLLGGRSSGPAQQAPKVEVSAKDYAQAALRGKILE